MVAKPLWIYGEDEESRPSHNSGSGSGAYIPETDQGGTFNSSGNAPSPAPVNPANYPEAGVATPTAPAPSPAPTGPTTAPGFYESDVPSRPPGNTESGGRVYIPETDKPGTPGSSGNTPSPPVVTPKPPAPKPPKPKQGDGITKDVSTGKRKNNFRAKRQSTAKLKQSSGRARFGGKVKKPVVKARSGNRAAKRTRRK